MRKTPYEVSGIRQRTVGRALKLWRERANLSQRDVAMALGYTTAQFVSNWERGVALPPFSVLPKLCRILSVPPKEIIVAVETCQDQMHKAEMEYLTALFKGSSKR